MNRNSLLTNNEGMPEWSNGADSRSVSLCLRGFESSFPHDGPGKRVLINIKMDKENRGLSEWEMKTEFFYHGTGSKYLDNQLGKYGRYQHDDQTEGVPDGIFVGLCQDTSLRYANDRVFHYTNSHPVVLKIPAKPIIHRVHQHPAVNDIVIDFLNQNEYEVLHFERDMEIMKKIGRI